METESGIPRGLPGVAKPQRFRPRFHYELLVCGIRGHELVGVGAAELREQDALVAREMAGQRWHRCLRCDSWLPFAEPSAPTSRHPPDRDQIALPIRGRPLRDKIVLRIIAIDRAVHFVVLGLLAAAVFLIASNQAELQGTYYRVLSDIQGTVGGPIHPSQGGLIGRIDELLNLRSGTLHLVGLALAAFAVVEGIEAVGLWMQKRWAEYLTLIATSALLPLEVYELTRTVTPFKVVALIVNIAIVVYLLLAKRLFGLRGGVEAEERARERDIGWTSLEETAPEAISGP